ncbi:MAG: Bax inhibitor-1/YccA family protein [Planctomycetota bacterium]|nr:Bax inhibitor-1/YccA family protein [Planctomycetota bacterium]
MRTRRSVLETSNPALRNQDSWHTGIAVGGDGTATLQGVVNKTGMLSTIAVIGGMLGIWLTQNYPSLLLPSGILGFISIIVVYFMIMRNPANAKGVAWLYALVQGAFLGVLTNLLDGLLASMEVVATGGLALQAFVITVSVLLAMLALYYFKILQPTKMFKSVVGVLTLGIFLTYVISFVMSLFGAHMPFLSISSAMEGGQSAYIGLGLNVLILGVASLWLIIDFGMIEEQLKSDAPKHMEWFSAFILMVTLIWIYLEAIKLCFRLALLFGKRD